MKIAYITDSGTGKTIEELAEKGILSVPLQITDGTQTYQDMVNLDKDNCIELLKQNHILKTSQPALGIIENLFTSLKNQNIDLIVACPICTGLSGTISAMETTAANLGMKIITIDTHVTAFVQEYIIVRIKELYEEGKSEQEIRSIVSDIIDSTNTLLIPTDLQHLKRGGRLTPMAATLAGLLKITPILAINKSTKGKIDVLEKIRTFSKAIQAALQIMHKDPINSQYQIIVSHVDDEETAKTIAAKIEEEFPDSDIHVMKLCNVVAAHTGLGCQAIQYFKKL